MGAPPGRGVAVGAAAGVQYSRSRTRLFPRDALGSPAAKRISGGVLSIIAPAGLLRGAP